MRFFLMNKYLIGSVIFFLAGIWGCAPPPSKVEFSTPAFTSVQIPDEIRKQPLNKKLIAFVGMENKSIYAADKLWDIASHILTTRLIEIGYFNVVDWQKMKKNFDELSLQTSSLVDTPERLVNVREQLSCDHFLGGAITFYDVSQSAQVSAMSKYKTITTTVRVDLWLQDTQTGEYMSAASGSGRSKQQFSGGLMGGAIGTWDVNAANKALDMAIDDALVKLLVTYHRRYKSRPSRPETASRKQPSASQPDVAMERPDPIINVTDFERKSSKWAIIIGLSRFMDSRITPLSYTEKDALAMYEYLTDPNVGRFMKDQVFLLTNDRATTFNIKIAIDTVSKHALPEDMVVIFLSTHGTPGRMDVEGVGYLVTYDTLADSLYATAFNMSELVMAVNRRIKAKTVVTLADACYSANSFKSIRFLELKGAKDLVVESASENIPQEMVKSALETEGFGMGQSTVQALSSGTGRVFITSSRASERSWESDQLEHGFFTYYLLKILKQNKGMISVQKAFDYLAEELPQAVMKEKGYPQNPVIGMASVHGDIFLGVEPAGSGSVPPTD